MEGGGDGVDGGGGADEGGGDGVVGGGVAEGAGGDKVVGGGGAKEELEWREEEMEWRGGGGAEEGRKRW